VTPRATAAQNRCRCSLRHTGGRPGERIGVERHDPKPAFACPSQLLSIKMLRRPLESAQYVSFAFTSRLIEAGVDASVGSVGDGYDNALAETTIELYKTEKINREGPWRTLAEVELATLEWVDWYNHERLHSGCGGSPPAEFEQARSNNNTQDKLPP
jgi:putative transposase